MIKLTKEQILAMHHELITVSGSEDGVRDEGLLDSAIAAPFHTFDGKFMLPTIQEKATRLGFGLIKNHPFLDGNKRIGVHVMLVTLAMNGIKLKYAQKELYEIILKVAASEASYDELYNWVMQHEHS